MRVWEIEGKLTVNDLSYQSLTLTNARSVIRPLMLYYNIIPATSFFAAGYAPWGSR